MLAVGRQRIMNEAERVKFAADCSLSRADVQLREPSA